MIVFCKPTLSANEFSVIYVNKKGELNMQLKNNSNLAQLHETLASNYLSSPNYSSAALILNICLVGVMITFAEHAYAFNTGAVSTAFTAPIKKLVLDYYPILLV